MNINYDILRTILIIIDENPHDINYPLNNIFLENKFPDFTNKNLIEEYIKYLVENGIIDGKIKGQIVYYRKLSPYASDFVQTIKDETIWNQIKENLNPIDNHPLRLVVETSYEIFKNSKIR